MNFYHHEPSAPPRKKRSLSTSGFDSQESYHQHRQQQGYDNFGFHNRMKSNFSEKHIPTLLYAQSPNNFQPLLHSFNHPNRQNFPQNHQQNSKNYALNPQNFPLPNQQQTRQPTTLINNQPSLLFAAMAGPLPRFVQNPYSLHSSPSLLTATTNRFGAHVRPHYDYLKAINVQYNPYQSKFNPTLMAKPSLEGYQSSQISTPITTAIATRRDPKYSSKEKLNQLNLDLNDSSFHQVCFAQSKTPPARPPPPNIHSRLSMGNLSASTINNGFNDSLNNNDYAVVDKTRVRDRRSLSPTRMASYGGIQKPHTSSRPTSPLKLTSNLNMPQFSCSNSRTPSRESSPIRNFFNFSSSSITINSPKNLLSPKSLNRPAFFHENFSSYNISNSSSYKNKSNEYDDFNRRQPHQMDELQVPDSFMAKRMTELKNKNPNNYPIDQQFSREFTDHCDQYKSVTSKILGSKKNNTNQLNEDFSNNVQKNCNNGGMKSSMDTTVENNSTKETAFINPKTMTKPLNDNLNGNIETFAAKLGEQLLVTSKLQKLRRHSSNSNLMTYQRKSSLPTDYIASKKNNDQLKLSDDWSRENVHLVHEAYERKLKPQSQFKQKVQRIGVLFTKKFIFLLICALNLALAYLFYNLIAVLPN